MSDWLGALTASAGAEAEASPADGVAPAWLSRLAGGTGSGFCEAALFGQEPAAPPVSKTQSEPEPEPAPPAPDPLAETAARAFAEGMAQGRAEAQAENAALAQRHRALRLNFRSLDEAASAVLAEDLADTVLALCEAVLGEAARDPAGLRTRAEAAARRIGAAPDGLVLHLHPDDTALIDEGALSAMRIVADASLAPGSVMIEGPEGTASDGPAEWRRALAAMVRG